jgi:exopolysaccharide biosynthesis polyprenyl glycosylphosphotransferase
MVHRTRRSDGDLLQPTLFLVSDLIALEAAFLLTYTVRFLSGWLATPLGIPPLHGYLYSSFILLLVWVGIFYSQGLYHPYRRKSLEEDFAGLVRSVIIGSMVVLAMAFFWRKASYSRTFFVLFFATSLLFLFVGRVVSRWALRRYLRRGVGVSRVLLVGESGMRDRLLETFERLPGLGFLPVGQIVTEGRGPAPAMGSGGGSSLPTLGGLDRLESVIDEERVDTVLLALPFDRLNLVTDVAERLGPYPVDVQFVPDMAQIHTSRMRVKEIAGLPFISVRETGLSGIDRIVKRAVDIVFSAAALLVLSPVLLAIAVLVKLSSPGPVLYRQARLGRDHRPFAMLKFRTMRSDAEASSGPVWTMENDPRRTRIGTFLRRFSLDELPQFWNVLRGDMSLVGPRPEREHFAEQFHAKVPRYLERHRVRSGLTGWAQVHGLRGNTPIELRTLYDLHYVENWSLELDLRILLRTVLSVIRGHNAY